VALHESSSPEKEEICLQAEKQYNKNKGFVIHKEP